MSIENQIEKVAHFYTKKASFDSFTSILKEEVNSFCIWTYKEKMQEKIYLRKTNKHKKNNFRTPSWKTIFQCINNKDNIYDIPMLQYFYLKKKAKQIVLGLSLFSMKNSNLSFDAIIKYYIYLSKKRMLDSNTYTITEDEKQLANRIREKEKEREIQSREKGKIAKLYLIKANKITYDTSMNLLTTSSTSKIFPEISKNPNHEMQKKIKKLIFPDQNDNLYRNYTSRNSKKTLCFTQRKNSTEQRNGSKGRKLKLKLPASNSEKNLIFFRSPSSRKIINKCSSCKNISNIKKILTKNNTISMFKRHDFYY